jgi:ankyrin repeat protein
VDDLGWTVLHVAVRSGHLDTVKLLIEEFGVDKDLVANDGSSPLRIARHFLTDMHQTSKYLHGIGAHDSLDTPRNNEL